MTTIQDSIETTASLAPSDRHAATEGVAGSDPAASAPFDPNLAAPAVDVSQYGFEGRFDDLTGDDLYFEYTKAANPLASGHVSRVPIKRFSPSLHASGPS